MDFDEISIEISSTVLLLITPVILELLRRENVTLSPILKMGFAGNPISESSMVLLACFCNFLLPCLLNIRYNLSVPWSLYTPSLGL